MSRLRLPDLHRVAPDVGAPPPPPTPVRAVAILLTRRQFLRALGAAGVVAATPWTRATRAWAARRGRFFTGAERRTLAALVDTIIPPDADPGAADLGVVDYIERLLTAFEHRVPTLYAGGPFSGRNPFIDYDTGTPSRRRPRNQFRHFVAPSNLQALYWRWQIHGTDGLSSDERARVAPLDAQLGGPLSGLRTVYRDGLAQLDALARTEAGKPFAKLDPDTRSHVRDLAAQRFPLDARRGQRFIGIVAGHTFEGAFAAPEYGGNRRGRGWAMIGLEGDSQPLGYALYARADDAMHERADHPLSTPNPAEVAGPTPLSAYADAIQQFIVATTSGLPEGC